MKPEGTTTETLLKYYIILFNYMGTTWSCPIRKNVIFDVASTVFSNEHNPGQVFSLEKSYAHPLLDGQITNIHTLSSLLPIGLDPRLL